MHSLISYAMNCVLLMSCRCGSDADAGAEQLNSSDGSRTRELQSRRSGERKLCIYGSLALSELPQRDCTCEEMCMHMRLCWCSTVPACFKNVLVAPQSTKWQACR